MNERKFKKLLLLALEKANAADLPGNFISLSPEGKLAAIPWGSENLHRLIEVIMEESIKILGTLADNENLEALNLMRELSDQREEFWTLREKLDHIQEMTRD